MSAYQRKYHVENTLADICSKKKTDLSPNEKGKIFQIFEEIDKIFPQVNKERKRLINVKFVLKQLFNQSINQLIYVNTWDGVAPIILARGSCIKRMTIKILS